MGLSPIIVLAKNSDNSITQVSLSEQPKNSQKLEILQTQAVQAVQKVDYLVVGANKYLPGEEIVERRTENTKTYWLGGSKMQSVISMGAIHYKDNYADSNEQWKDIDLTWNANYIGKAPYELWLEGNKITVRDKKTGEITTIERLDVKPAGIPSEIVPEHTRVSFRHILPSDKVPFEAQFKVIGNIPLTARAFDDEGELELETSLVGDILTEKLSIVKNKNTKQIRPVKGSIRIDPTLNLQVGASTDDAYRRLTAPYWALNASDIRVGAFGAATYQFGGGMRFLNVTIPQGTTIDAAYLTLRARAVTQNGTVVNTRISAEDVDNPATFADDAAAFDARWANRTTARVDWDDIPTFTSNVDYNSPEIKTVIQEVVDRGGWASGQAMVVFWDDFEDRSSHVSGAYREVYSYDGSTTYAPKLVITFVVPPTVTTQAATSIEDTTATGNGNITDIGGANADRKGIVWDLATQGDPGNVAPGASGYANDVGTNGSFGVGAFTEALTALPTGDTIYARAYAHNSAGYAYGAEVNFLTKPAAPTAVAATDGTDETKVVITWTKSTGATDYHVFRGVTDLGAAGDVATFDDAGATAGTITNSGTVTASDGISTAHVVLSLAAEATGTTSHSYTVVASNATGDSDASAADNGNRGVGAITYQWQRSAADSDAAYGDIGGATTDPYNDATAPAGVITTPGVASASDSTSLAHVVLSLAGESVADGAGRYYQAVLSSTGASNSPQTSDNNRGYRTTGAITHQWQRSAADSDAVYGNIGGGTTDPYNDTGAPANGDGRYYQDVISSTGASNSPQTSTSDRGYRSAIFLVIYVDGVEQDVVFLPSSVPDTADNWTLLQNNVIPYADSITISVNGIEVSRYEPVSMIIGINLPDETGSNNGTITWGSNPVGVGVTLGSMTSSGQPSVGATSDTSTDDILPVVGGTDWGAEPDVSGALLTNPFRPIVTTVSDNTTLSERQVWVWFGIIFVVFVTVLVGANVRGHHLITGIAASAAIILLVVWTMFPLWTLIVIVLTVWLGLVSERSPSL